MSDEPKTQTVIVKLPSGCGCLTLVALGGIAGLLFLILLKLCGVDLSDTVWSIFKWVGTITLSLALLVTLILGGETAISKYSRWQNRRFRDRANRSH
jgi:hypothetical protein